MFGIRYGREILVAAVVACVAIKISLDGYQIWEDRGGIAMSIAAFISCLLMTDYMDRLRDAHNVTYIILENRTNMIMYVQWGSAEEKAFGYGEYIPLEPEHCIALKVGQGMLRSTLRPCVRIAQNRNNMDRNVTIVLWDPKEPYHTKLYQITDQGVIEIGNPTIRGWFTGDLRVWQSADGI